MRKFLNDITEVGRDIWDGFVWLVEAADNAGEMAGEKFGEITRRKKKASIQLTAVNEEVRHNCVSWQ